VWLLLGNLTVVQPLSIILCKRRDFVFWAFFRGSDIISCNAVICTKQLLLVFMQHKVVLIVFSYM
jgi:hypothetical protein